MSRSYAWWPKAAREVHLVYLFAFDDTEERLRSESWDDPIDYGPVNCEGAASSPAARFFEFEWTVLELGCRFLSGSVVDVSSAAGESCGITRFGRYGPWLAERWYTDVCLMGYSQLWCHSGADRATSYSCTVCRAADLPTAPAEVCVMEFSATSKPTECI